MRDVYGDDVCSCENDQPCDHASDCAVHNEPAYENAICNCRVALDGLINAVRDLPQERTSSITPQWRTAYEIFRKAEYRVAEAMNLRDHP